MEGHEIPKNVSEFEFHLIGDMTVRQFAYLASGLGMAYFLFAVLSSSAPIVAWPLIILCILAGVAYAFLPISERPLDHWTASFFRAIFNPTQSAWKSKAFNIDSPAFQNRLKLYLFKLSTQNEASTSAVATKSSVLSSFNQSNAQQIVSQAKIPLNPKPPEPKKEFNPETEVKKALPSSQELNQTVELAKKAQLTQVEIIEAEKVVKAIRAAATTPGADTNQYSNRLEVAGKKLQGLQQEAEKISHDLAVLAKEPEIFEKKKVPIPVKPVNINIILTTTPNIINGIVTDSQGNYLEGVIIVAHDKQELPVRALKTNKLGQFLAATPLPNGVYTITLEKDTLSFDVLEIKLEGQVVPAIRVSAKKGELG